MMNALLLSSINKCTKYNDLYQLGDISMFRAEFVSETDIEFTISSHVFRINVIPGVYRSLPDTNENDEIESVTDYYVGTKTTRDGTDVTFIPAIGSNGRWQQIMRIDSLIDQARKIAYLELQAIFYDTTPKYTSARFANRIKHLFLQADWGYNKSVMVKGYHKSISSIMSENMPIDERNVNMVVQIGEWLYGKNSKTLKVTKKGLTKIKSIYDNHLCDVLMLRRTVDEGDDPEFYTQVFPNYEEPYGITIYTQIGSPQTDFLGSDIEDWRFSVDINPLVFRCKYNDLSNLDDNASEVDLFDPDPRTTMGIINKGALSIVMDRVFSDIVDNNFALYMDLYTTGDPGLTTDISKVTTFLGELVKQIKLNYPSGSKQDTSGYTAFNRRSDGVTLFAIGSVFIAMALDGIGLVDLAIDREITKEMTWDNIFYDIQRTDAMLKDLPTNFELVDFLEVEPQSMEGEVLLSEIGAVCASIMYQMTNEEGSDNA